MLINNTINTSGHFGGAKPPKDSTQEILKKLEKKSNVGHVHKKSDIEDFAHTHDERYYRKDISELNVEDFDEVTNIMISTVSDYVNGNFEDALISLL